MKRWIGLLALSVVAFGNAVAQSPDRSQPPPVGDPRPFVLPTLESFELSNGLEVWLLEKHDVPLVQVNLVVEAGRSREPQDGYGLASLTADMLDEGAGELSALELAEAFTFLGARFRISTGVYATTVSVRVPAGRLEDAVVLMSDVVLRPAFDASELERLRVDRLTDLVTSHDEPDIVARELYLQTLYGETNPYGRSNLGNEASLRSFSSDDLRGFYETFYRPNNATLIVVGDATVEGIRPLLDAAFGLWEPTEVPAVAMPLVTQVTGRKVYLVDKPGAAQSVIRIGRLGAARGTDDYYALEVLNTVLGGAFTSRLMQNLREDKGYTYGAWSYFDYGRSAGPFTAGASVETSVTGLSLVEFMTELTNIMEPVPDGELERSRNYLAMSFPQDFSSVADIMEKVEDLQQFGLPPDHYNHFVGAVLGVTQDDVTAAAQRYLDPENLAIVVVGDRSAIEGQVRDLNLGDIEFLTVNDVLGNPPDLSGN